MAILTVVEEGPVSETVDEAASKYKFADDVFQAAIWRIAREPGCGDILEGLNPERRILYLPPVTKAQSPGLIVRYYYDEERVMIDWVKFYPYKESDAVMPRAYVASRR